MGRIITRFSKDLTVTDYMLPSIAIFVTQGIFRAISVAITVSIVNPYILIAIVVVLALMYWVAKMGSQVLVETYRLDSIYRGPIHQ